MMTFGVPSGIGDVSWLYSKLGHLGPNIWEVADGWPYRTVPFLVGLPGVRGSSYSRFTYRDIIAFEETSGIGTNPTWEQVSKYANNGRLLIECNRHLESGNRLEDWMSDLPTNFHYEIPLHDEDITLANALVADLPRPLIGISAASYRGSEAWKTWGLKEWRTTLEYLKSHTNGTIILLGGFWDDLTFSLAQFGYYDLVGKTNVPSMVHVLDLLDLYIGFSSGMGILRTVQNKPSFMLWPEHQQLLSTSWAPLEHLETGKYVASQWHDPEIVLPILEGWIDRNLR